MLGFLSGMAYRVRNLETDTVLARIVDDVPLIGRRWTIRDADGEEVAKVRSKGKLGALAHELGVNLPITGPMRMEFVAAGGRPVGTVDRSVGPRDRLTVSVDADASDRFNAGVNQRIRLGDD